jgi:RHS repeat-associated protein
MTRLLNTVLVGDPVDVISGNQYDVALDFRIAWAFPFEWRRFYNTDRCKDALPLGWGHTHSYDHRLIFDADGLLYTDPSGARHGFAFPAADRKTSVSSTGTLQRISDDTYRVKVAGFLLCEFQFADPSRPAQLRRVFRGRSFHRLLYSREGRWVGLAYKNEPRVRIESDGNDRIRRLVWLEGDGGRDRMLWTGTYDSDGNLIHVADVYGTEQTFHYDSAHRIIRHVDRRGYGLEASFDAAGRCARSAGEDGMQEVRLRYSPEVNLTVVTRADGGEWQYFYAPEGIRQVVDPYGGVTERTYDRDGTLISEVGPAGNVQREVIDEESRLIGPRFGPTSGVCLPIGDPWFLPVRDLHLPKDALGWDGHGRSRARTAIRLPLRDSPWLAHLPPAVTAHLHYREDRDEAEPLVIQTASGPFPKKPLGVRDRPGVMRRDAFGRLLAHVAPTGDSARWQYDANGNVIRYVDYAGSEWRYEYASWNLRVRETNPLNQAITYEFNRLEQPIAVVDPGGTATVHNFDLKDRKVERRRHHEVRDVFGYDLADGLVLLGTGSAGLRIRLKLGPHRRPVEIASTSGSVRRCDYDDKGRLISVAEEDGHKLRFAYDRWGDLTLDLQNGRGVERSYASSRLAEWTVLGRFTVRYVYDRETRLTTVFDPTGRAHTVSQLDSGIFHRHHANGTHEVFQYDSSGRCLAKVRFRGNDPQEVWSRVFEYSPVGALRAAEDSRRGREHFDYDSAHRLINARGSNRDEARFVYDPGGNVVAAPGLDGVSLQQNKLLTANGHAFEYNARHHISRESGVGPQREFLYDDEDRLTEILSGDTRITFEYDALGRRLLKRGPDGAVHFVWDGERLAAEIASTGALRVYVYGDDYARTPVMFVDYPSVDADPESGVRRYVFSNQIGCPEAVEDDTGSLIWRATIEPYGRAAIDNGSSIDLNLRWPGHYFDRETGLHYNRHRYYSPDLARYIQVDLRDIEGGLNVYAYTSRPLDDVDVDGLAPCPKKPMVTPDENDPEFQKAKQRADQMAEDLRQAVKEAVDNGELHPQAAAGTTLATMVVLRQDGTYEVVVTGNRSDLRLPQGVQEAMGDHRFVGHGDDRPPPVRQGDEDWRYGRDNPRSGERDDSTHNHAEQRGLRAADCDPDTQGVAYIAPTRPCCEGCSSAIQTPHSDGGWGGSDTNVSDRGRQSGSHGSWWES